MSFELAFIKYSVHSNPLSCEPTFPLNSLKGTEEMTFHNILKVVNKLNLQDKNKLFIYK